MGRGRQEPAKDGAASVDVSALVGLFFNVPSKSCVMKLSR